jgi:Na+/glutamate symporter
MIADIAANGRSLNPRWVNCAGLGSPTHSQPGGLSPSFQLDHAIGGLTFQVEIFGGHGTAGVYRRVRQSDQMTASLTAVGFDSKPPRRSPLRCNALNF